MCYSPQSSCASGTPTDRPYASASARHCSSPRGYRKTRRAKTTNVSLVVRKSQYQPPSGSSERLSVPTRSVRTPSFNAELNESPRQPLSSTYVSDVGPADFANLEGHTFKRAVLQEALCVQDSGNTHVGILVAGYDGGWPGLPPDRPIDRMARLNELPAPRVPGRPRFITCSFPVVSGSPIPQRHATSEKADPVRVDGYWARCRARNANDGGSCDKKNGSVWQP